MEVLRIKHGHLKEYPVVLSMRHLPIPIIIIIIPMGLVSKITFDHHLEHG